MTNLSRFKTTEAAAKALYREICKAAKDMGQNPEIEVRLMRPADSRAAGRGMVWRVMWEAGPHEWGIKASFGDFTVIAAKWDQKTEWYMEPHYSFDVGFCE